MACCNKCSKWCCSLIKIGMIIYEILDKLVDIATAVEYYKGRLFYNPKEPVYTALLAFVIIGCIISAARISLYVWRIYLKCSEDESYEKRYDDLDIGIHMVKVIFEAFPQSVIAKFYFVHCPIKKYGWGIKILDPAFDTFCGLPFIFFLVSLFCCYCCKYGTKCGGETEQVYENWVEKVRCNCWALALFTTFIISVVGLGFASSSLREFDRRCSIK